MPYILIWSEEVRKDFKKLDLYVAKRIYEKIETMNSMNRLLLEKVTGSDDYKYRVGAYRIFFSFKGENRYLVKAIEHRRNAYKKR